MGKKNIKEIKQEVINEITTNVQDSSSVVFFEYSGLTVTELTELRRLLRNNESDLKVYKNTLAKRALDTLDIDINEHLVGPKAMAFGKDVIAPIKVLNDFSKKHKSLQMKVGIVEGEITNLDVLTELANIPSKDGLLTMLAAGLMENVKNLAICLDLHAQNLENQ